MWIKEVFAHSVLMDFVKTFGIINLTLAKVREYEPCTHYVLMNSIYIPNRKHKIKIN